MNYSFQPFVRYAAKSRHHLGRTAVARDCRLLYILSGSGSFECDGEVFPLSKNALIYYPCGTHYRIRSAKGDPLLFYTVNFDFTQEFSHLTDTLYPLTEREFSPDSALCTYVGFDVIFSKTKYIPNAVFAEPLLSSVCEESETRQIGFRRLQEAQLTVLLINLCRAAGVGQPKDPLYDRICALVAEDLSRSNKELAELLGYHPYYLNSFFKKCAGVTLHQYVIERRLSKAYGLITTTDLPMESIALSCGFSSPSHFSSLFQRKYLCRPIRLRRQT